jgi:hypothetical protein
MQPQWLTIGCGGNGGVCARPALDDVLGDFINQDDRAAVLVMAGDDAPDGQAHGVLRSCDSMLFSSSCARSNPARPRLGLLVWSLSIRRSAASTRSRARCRSATVYCRGCCRVRFPRGPFGALFAGMADLCCFMADRQGITGSTIRRVLQGHPRLGFTAGLLCRLCPSHRPQHHTTTKTRRAAATGTCVAGSDQYVDSNGRLSLDSPGGSYQRGTSVGTSLDNVAAIGSHQIAVRLASGHACFDHT